MRAAVLAWCWLAALLTGGVAAGADLPGDAQVVEYGSPAVGLSLKYAVLLPDGYDASTQRYPVLYLLHGHTGHHTSWLTYAGLPPDTATRLGAIVVLADGGNGFYVNWHGAEGQRPNRWEDAIVEDLISAVDRRWRTHAERSGRAIGGLSMGGYGAITIALRHPDLFGAAFSSAGALRFPARAREELRTGNEDWNRPELWSNDERPPVPITGFATQRERTPRGRVFVIDAQTRDADPFELARIIDPRRAPFIHLDCGLQDSLLPETLAFAQQLRESGLSHALVLLPGDHEVPYWAEAFARTRLALQSNFTARAVAPAGPLRP